MKGTPIDWQPKELRWIRARATRPRRETHAEFQKIFGRRHVTLQNFNTLCKRKGWLTGRDGRYVKGAVPANKGQAIPFNANSAKTRFRKGNRSGRAAERYHAIGTERVTKNGYVERKIHDGLPMQSRWRAVHLIRWEQAAGGPVPPGSCLKCLDGNKANCDPSNWLLLPRALLPRLNGRFGRNYDAAPAELKTVIMAIAQLEHKAREKRKTAREADTDGR